MNAASWQHRWFGFWREEGPEFEDCPALLEWERSRLDGSRRETVAHRLTRGPVVIANGPMRCLLCAQFTSAAVGYRTDGTWYWSDMLSHYVLEHDISLPSEFLARILRSELEEPKLWSNQEEYRALTRRLDAPKSHRAMLDVLAKEAQEPEA